MCQDLVRRTAVSAVIALVWSWAGAAARAQTSPLLSYDVVLSIDSGPVSPDRADGLLDHRDEPVVVFSTIAAVRDAPWLRLHFGDVHLSGSLRRGTGAFLRLTSLEDGAVQRLDARSLAQWQFSSAWFNGDAVRLELLAYRGTGPSRLAVTGATAGIRGQVQPLTQCGPTDDRVPSSDPRQGRTIPGGCTAFMIDDMQHCFLTAGHCFDPISVTTVEFDVPLSDPDGTPNFASPDDQYAVDPASVQSSNTSFSDDWAYFGCFANSNTGLTPAQAQGAFYTLAAAVPPADNGTISITGYGLDFDDPELSNTQQVDSGTYDDVTPTQIRYDDIDTESGLSGAAILKVSTDEVVGLHVGGDCELPQLPTNIGMRIDNAGLQTALANPQGICAEPAPVCGPDAESCFEVHDTPGCDNAECCLAVCAQDPFCCETLWDTLCVTEAEDLCAGCGGIGTGSCFEANGTPFCDNQTCCEAVCAQDAFCCSSSWDAICKGLANTLCGNCGSPGSASCFQQHPAPGCSDAACCRTVCDMDPDCCEVGWDFPCVDLANEHCCQLDCSGPGEFEPDCGLDAGGMPDDTTNGGCNSDPPVFEPIACGDSVCGTAAYRADTGFRDTDWYELVLDGPAEITWEVEAEFPVDLSILDGSAGCPNPPAVANGAGDACAPVSITANVDAGTYYLFVAPTFTGLAVPCGAQYSASVIGSPCPSPCGDLCLPGNTPENEPDCGLDDNGQSDDFTNGGCNSNPFVVSPISCGESICGTAGSNSAGAITDTDWYELVLDEPADILWSVTAEFDSFLGVIDLSGGCPGTLFPFGNGQACEKRTLTASLDAGTWYLFVRPATGAIVPCGAEYNATVTCLGPPTGACCFVDGTCAELTETDCGSTTGSYLGDGTTCAPNDCPQPPDLIDFYTGLSGFSAAVDAAGKTLKGVEDFTEAVIAPDEILVQDDPLDTTTDNGIFVPGDILFNLAFQSNTNGTPGTSDPGTSGPNPRGTDALAVLGPGALGVTTHSIAANQFDDSLDIISLNPNHTALGIHVVDITAGVTLEVRVFDTNDQLAGVATVPGDDVNGAFLGMVAQDGVTIGRVNLWSPGLIGGETLYDVIAFVNLGPCPWDLDGSGDVGTPDFLSLLAQWGTDPGGPPDFDADGTVGTTDFLELLANWGPCPP